MKEMAPALGGVIATICFLSIVAAITYGCQRSDAQYYESMHNCVDRGGTWIPTNATNSAACVAGPLK